MIQVTERKTVPENCSTCLYGPNAVRWDGKPVGRLGCSHADRQKDWMLYGMGLKALVHHTGSIRTGLKECKEALKDGKGD